MFRPVFAHTSCSFAVKMRVLLGGCGPTGARLAALLSSDTVKVVAVDKGRRAGGRCTTFRSHAAGSEGSRSDTGAQYFTCHAPEKHRAAFEGLVAAGVLKRMSPATHPILGQSEAQAALDNFYAPEGVSAVPAHWLKASGAEVKQSLRIVSVNKSADGRAWRVSAVPEGGGGGGGSGAPPPAPVDLEADALVLTLPTPQLLGLEGDVKGLLEASGVAAGLRGVTYSSRYALSLTYGPDAWPSLRAAMPWVGRYVSPEQDPDGAVRWVSFDSAKRGVMGRGEGKTAEGDSGSGVVEAAPTIVLHSSVGFGQRYLEANPDTDVAPRMLAALATLVPGLPAPVAVKAHRWRYSQVLQPYVGAEGVPPGAVVVCTSPPLLLAGDAFAPGGSNLEGCMDSAAAAAAALKGLGLPA